MPIMSILVRKLLHHFSRLSWKSLTAVAFGHLVLGYLICWLAAQPHLIESWHSYFHFWIVTISTVGYGDFYAQGGWEKILVDIWFIGLGLGLFGSLLGKTAELMFQIINKHVQGMKNFTHLTDHIVIFCNQRLAAIRIIELLLADKKRQNRTILLCSTDQDLTHPMPEHESVEFARLDSFMARDEMTRVNLAAADRVVINADSDDENLALTVHVSGLVADDCHLVSHFDDESHIESLHRLNLKVECSTSKRIEQLVRASQDHGSTAVINQLLDTRKGMTLYVANVTVNNKTFADLKSQVYQATGADIIGVATDALGQTLQILPAPQQALANNIYVHYMHNERLPESVFEH